MPSTTFPWTTVQTFLGEFFVSFLFGFVVYSAVLTVNLEEISAGPILISLALGFSGVALIYSFLDITIAHFNPVVTVNAMIFRKLPVLRGFVFIVMQLCGFMAAAGAVLGCFPGDCSDLLDIINPGPVSDKVSNWELILTEAILSGILVFVAFSVAINRFKKPVYNTLEGEELLTRPEDDTPDTTVLGPLCIGLTLGFLALLGGSSSGGAFNPAVVWAPVLFSGKWGNSWKYWVGEFVGGFIGALCQFVLMTRMY